MKKHSSKKKALLIALAVIVVLILGALMDSTDPVITHRIKMR